MSTVVHARRRPLARAILASTLGTALVLSFAATSASASSRSCLPNCPPVVGEAFGFVDYVAGSYVIESGYNSAGQTDTVTNPSEGAYVVTLPGLTAGGGTANVTDFAATCMVKSWSASASGTTLAVRCFDANGSPTPDDFAFTFTSQRQNGLPYAYALVDNATAKTSTPNLTYQFDQGSTIKVKHGKTGAYSVSIPFVGYGTGGTAKVTAYDQDASCAVVNLNGPTSTEKVSVACAGPAGPVNTEFTITFLRENNLLDQSALVSGYARLDPPAATGSFAATGNYWTWDSAGGTIDAYKSATGEFTVHFPGVATSGNAQVTTLGTKANRCRVGGISAGGGTTSVNVTCTKMTGTSKYVDNPFMVQLTSTS